VGLVFKTHCGAGPQACRVETRLDACSWRDVTSKASVETSLDAAGLGARATVVGLPMKLRVAVLQGGRSGEHEISLRSARSIMQALDPSRYDALPFTIDHEGKWSPHPILPEPGANPDIDVVFPALHGTFGEDGTVQGLLELADLPYVGAGVLSSAVSMDKEIMKRVCGQRGLPVVEYAIFSRSNLDTSGVFERFGFPLFVKPANLGSSVGISKAHSAAELEAALLLAAQFDRKIIVERAIAGQELECAVLGNDDPVASLPCEILPSREFYDYEDKYLLDQAKIELPARIPPAKTEELRRLAVECYRAVECSGMARVDFLLESSSGQLYINEINTIPGFTSISMYPKMWEHSGLPMPKLIDRLIDLALERHAAKKATRFKR
jgi:D-alanine-D-alanine ligase